MRGHKQRFIDVLLHGLGIEDGHIRIERGDLLAHLGIQRAGIHRSLDEDGGSEKAGGLVRRGIEKEIRGIGRFFADGARFSSCGQHR